jgi:hypothetical protein
MRCGTMPNDPAVRRTRCDGAWQTGLGPWRRRSTALPRPVLANQLVTSFIPAVPGWMATQNLLHDGYL